MRIFSLFTVYYLQPFYRQTQVARWYFGKGEGGRPGLIYYTLNQSCLANHFPVSRWENNTADQSKLHSFLCYLVIYCSLSHVSCHKPDCGTQGDWERGTESSGKGVKQSEMWRSSYKKGYSTCLFMTSLTVKLEVFKRPMSPFTADLSDIFLTRFKCMRKKTSLHISPH